MSKLPQDPQLTSLLREAYAPCRFFGQCKEAKWNPKSGHIPRGFLGATAALDQVQLVMVFAEPGHPHADEEYGPNLGADALMQRCTSHAYDSFKNGTDLFHRNVRWFIDQLYPNLTFDEQLRHVWLTEGRLCSIDNEIGNTRDRTCASHFLAKQVALMPNATVVAFGGKARHYLKCIGIDFVGAYALAPPGANHKPAKPSWQAAIDKVSARRDNTIAARTPD